MKSPEQAELAELCQALLEILRAAQAANQDQEAAPVQAGRGAAEPATPLAGPRQEGTE